MKPIPIPIPSRSQYINFNISHAPANKGQSNMKLLRYGPVGHEKPGLVDDDGCIRDLSCMIRDISGDILHPQHLRALATLDFRSLPRITNSPRLGAPVAGVGKIIGVGLNYRSHAAEIGATSGEEPLLFSKATSSITGPNDAIIIPRSSLKTDWEVELAVIIGARARYVDALYALDYVAGYTVINDVSERSFQKERGGQFLKGKSADSFAPLGPWLVTPDEIPDPQNLALWLDLNERRQQAGNTNDMIFPVSMIISYISFFMTLLPGDVIATGTPAGVGAGQKPPVYLKPGDQLALGIDGLGRQSYSVRAHDTSS
jgi:2,4-didehydro-3-deoxy-L-rhamnonate hydrolase